MSTLRSFALITCSVFGRAHGAGQMIIGMRRPDQPTIAVEVPADATVAKLLEEYRAMPGVTQSDDYKLTFAEEPLDDTTATLADLGVGAEAVVDVAYVSGTRGAADWIRGSSKGTYDLDEICCVDYKGTYKWVRITGVPCNGHGVPASKLWRSERQSCEAEKPRNID